MKNYPDWMTEEARITLKKGFYGDEKNVYDAWNRIVNSAAFYLKKEGLSDEFCADFAEDLFDILDKGWLGLATPVFSELGTGDRGGLPISCFSLSVSDSIRGIFDSLAESALMTKNGGGVGVYLGRIRGLNEIISTGGTSAGSVPFARLYDYTAKTVAQASFRRGSFALYLPIHHKDILLFLKSKDHTEGDSRRWIDSNIAVTIEDWWMEEMLAGDQEKREIFIEVLMTRMKCGSPYLLFVDNVNRQNPEAYVKNNLKVETSNLCFTANTLVSTVNEKGELKQLPIKQLEGTCFNVLSASYNYGWKTETQPAICFKTGTAKVVKVTLANGNGFRCTEDHPLALNGENSYVEAKNSLSRVLATADNIGIEVIKVEEIAEKEEVYDLKVAKNENFYIHAGTGILVHNCSEIMLYTDEDHSFVCCLSSLNLDKWPEWKNAKTKKLGLSIPYISTIFLDAVLSEFIDKASKIIDPKKQKYKKCLEELISNTEDLDPDIQQLAKKSIDELSNIPELTKAVRSAKKGRALGLGVMGLASLYQKLNLAWHEPETYALNIEIHNYIYSEARKASKFLAENLGEPEWCVGTGYRNSHNIAIAPTRTNSAVCSTISMGIEPIESNLYIAKQDKGIFPRRNPNLEKLLKEKYKKNTPEVWEEISKNDGSVKNLDFMDKHDKWVFRTAREIDQFDLIRQAADRQKYVDQGQSLNLFVDPFVSPQYYFGLHVAAWKLGLKSLYYLRTKSKQSLSTVNYMITKKGCPWCEKLSKLLEERGISYIPVTLSEAKRKGLWNKNYKTVPQLFLDGQRIGGYTDYVEKFISGSHGFATPGRVDGQVQDNECSSCEG